MSEKKFPIYLKLYIEIKKLFSGVRKKKSDLPRT